MSAAYRGYRAPFTTVSSRTVRAHSPHPAKPRPPQPQLLEEGQVWLQPANVTASLTSSTGVLLFRAQANA